MIISKMINALNRSIPGLLILFSIIFFLVIISKFTIINKSQQEVIIGNQPVFVVSNKFSSYITKIDDIEYRLIHGDSLESAVRSLPESTDLGINSDNENIQINKKILDFIGRQKEFDSKVVENYFSSLKTIGNEKSRGSLYDLARTEIRKIDKDQMIKMKIDVSGYPDKIDALYNKIRRYEKDILLRTRGNNDSTNNETKIKFKLAMDQFSRLITVPYDTYFKENLRVEGGLSLVYSVYDRYMRDLILELEKRNTLHANYESEKEKLVQLLDSIIKDYASSNKATLAQKEERLPFIYIIIPFILLFGLLILSLIKISDENESKEKINLLTKQYKNDIDSQNIKYNAIIEDLTQKYQQEVENILLTNLILNNISRDVSNFRTFESLTQDLRKKVKEIKGIPLDFIFTLYVFEPEFRHLKAYICNKNETVTDSIFHIDNDKRSKAVEIFNQYQTEVVKIESTDISGDLKDERASRIYKLLLTKERKRLGLVSFQSGENNAFNDNHNKILESISIFVTAALDFDNTMNALNAVSNLIIDNNDFERLVENIYISITKILDNDFNFAIGIVNEKLGTIDFTSKEHGVVGYQKSSDSLKDLKLLSIQRLKSMPILIEDKEAYVRSNPGVRFPERQEFIYRNSFIYVPIRFKENNIGLLTVQSNKKRAFSQKHFDFLQVVSVILAQLFIGNEYSTLNSRLSSEEGEELVNKLALSSLEYDKLLLYLQNGDIDNFFTSFPLHAISHPLVLTLKLRYENYRKKEFAGTLSNQESIIEYNKIITSLIQLMEFANKMKGK